MIYILGNCHQWGWEDTDAGRNTNDIVHCLLQSILSSNGLPDLGPHEGNLQMEKDLEMDLVKDLVLAHGKNCWLALKQSWPDYTGSGDHHHGTIARPLLIPATTLLDKPNRSVCKENYLWDHLCTHHCTYSCLQNRYT